MRYRIGGSCGETISQIAHISSNTTAAWQIFPPDICGGCLHQISFRLVAASATLCSLLEDHDLLVWLEWFVAAHDFGFLNKFTRVLCFHIQSLFDPLGSEMSNFPSFLHVAEILQQFWGYQKPCEPWGSTNFKGAGNKIGVPTAVFTEYGHPIPTPMEVLSSCLSGCCHRWPTM